MQAAQNCVPVFHHRRQLTSADLMRIQEPAVIFEHHGCDSDGVDYYLYTVAGWLDGANVATLSGGCTVSGEVILIHADSRYEADLLAGLGLQDTIDALKSEGDRYIEAQAALARLKSVSPKQRLDLATKAEKSADFIDDTNAVRPLIGDDIVLAAGRVN